MDELSRRLRLGQRVTTILFALAATAFIAALCLPLVIVNMNVRVTADTGLETFLKMLAVVVRSTRNAVTDANLSRLTFTPPYLAATLANVTLLLNAIVGRWVYRRHAIPMLILSVIGLLSLLSIPVWLKLIERSTLWPSYMVPLVGYWLWLSSLILVTCGWVSLLWTRRRLRRMVAGPTIEQTSLTSL